MRRRNSGHPPRFSAANWANSSGATAPRLLLKASPAASMVSAHGRLVSRVDNSIISAVQTVRGMAFITVGAFDTPTHRATISIMGLGLEVLCKGHYCRGPISCLLYLCQGPLLCYMLRLAPVISYNNALCRGPIAIALLIAILDPHCIYYLWHGASSQHDWLPPLAPCPRLLLFVCHLYECNTTKN